MVFVIFVRTNSGRSRGEAVGVPAEDFEAVLAAGELPGLVRGDGVEPFDFVQDRLGGEAGEIAGGRQ